MRSGVGVILDYNPAHKGPRQAVRRDASRPRNPAAATAGALGPRPT